MRKCAVGANVAGISFSKKPLSKVISGGQTGADQAGLFAAFKCGFETGGQAPENYWTEHGVCPLLEVFGLVAKGTYKQRTIANIENSDATIIIGEDLTSAGSKLTFSICKNVNKPCLRIQIFKDQKHSIEDVQQICNFIQEHEVVILNIAGNRERYKNSAIFLRTKNLLIEAFTNLQEVYATNI